MKPLSLLTGAMLLFSNPHLDAAPMHSAAKWKRIRVVELVTGTDNGGEIQVFSFNSSRKIHLVIGLSNCSVETDYVFEQKKLILVDRERTYFDLGADGIDFTKPSLIENGRYRFLKWAKNPSYNAQKKSGGRWQEQVAIIDDSSAAQMLKDARFYLRVAASNHQTDIENWIKYGK